MRKIVTDRRWLVVTAAAFALILAVVLFPTSVRGAQSGGPGGGSPGGGHPGCKYCTAFTPCCPVDNVSGGFLSCRAQKVLNMCINCRERGKCYVAGTVVKRQQ